MNKYVIFIVFGSFIFWQCQKKIETPKQVSSPATINILTVKLAPVERLSTTGSIQTLGTFINKSEARPAFKTGGVIASTYFKEGDKVKKGQVLSTLIMTEINAQVNQALQAVKKAERDVQRINNLFLDSVATLEQKQNVETALAVAKNNLAIAKFNQDHSTVISPLEGRIIKQVLHSGEIAGPGMPVYIIMSTQQADWRVTTGLLDYEWAQIQINQPAEITLDAYPGQNFPAIITDRSTLVTNASGKLDIELKLHQLPPALAAGMICKIVIPVTSTQSLPVIPIDALVRSDGAQAEVFVINEQNLAKKIPIRIHKLLGDKVAVQSGLEGVEKVVTIGSIYLEDGDKVQVAN